jgi:hypothetical protein
MSRRGVDIAKRITIGGQKFINEYCDSGDFVGFEMPWAAWADRAIFGKV